MNFDGLFAARLVHGGVQQALAQTASAKGFSHYEVIDNRDGRAVGDVREDEQVEKTSDHIIDLRHPSPVTRVAPQRIPHGLLGRGVDQA